MQPPPRKGNYVKFLKNLHSEQVAKLQLKNQHECDLLEDIRQFTIKRSAIEKSYSEALLKISSQYLNKKIPNIPDIKMEGMEERWNMWSVWRTVLEENEKLARARLAAIEVFQQQIADEAKVLRDYKVAIAKKSLSQIVNVQKELHLSVGDLDKAKKQYFDEEHCAHDVRDKARDIEEKLKKKKGSFFQSITSLQKNSARVTSRKELLEEKSTGARNDYILSLAAGNAHQNRYFTVDLQTTMTTMENYVFERVAEYLTLMGRTELLTCSATQNSFGKIRDQAQQLTREYNLQCCYLFYPVLKQHIQYDFEPCDNDPVRKVTTEHESAVETLTKEARNLAGRIVKENVSVRENAKKLAICVALRDSGQRSDPNDPNGPDLDTKIEDYRDLIRRSETEKAKAEACLQCLREGGINVDEWVQEAEIIGAQELTRSASSISMRTDASGQGENPSSDSFYDSDKEDTGPAATQAIAGNVQEETQLTRDQTFSDSEDETEEQIPEPKAAAPMMSTAVAGWDDPTEVNWGEEEDADKEESSMAPEIKEAIFKCTALYSYTAQNPDELTIVENEQLEVIGEGDGDGWLRARNYRGEEGYVPHNYLDIEQEAAVNDAAANVLRSQISFSSVDYTVDTEDQTGDSMQSPDQVSVIMAPATTTISAAAPITQKKHSDIQYCIALYDYDATAEDELTFEEGQIIKIVTKTAHGVDDGWWEGELDGKFGNFPSLVVEECDENGDPLSEEGEDISPPTSAVPSIALPPAPTLPPEYAHELNDDMFGSQDTADDDSGYIPNGSVPNMPAPVHVEESGEENESEDGDRAAPPAQTPPALNITSKTNKSQGLGDTLNLGMAQIVVTAATPMIENGRDKSFPPADDTSTKDKDKDMVKGNDEQEIGVKTPEKVTQKSIVETGHKTKKIPKTTENVKAKIEGRQDNEACGVTVTLTTASPKSDDSHSSSSDQEIDGTDAQPIEEAEDPFNEKTTVTKSDECNANRATFEANFEANFEDAFADSGNVAKDSTEIGEDEEQTPKQVVGGRASIPEELDSNQLARLQNLKESNA